MAGEAETKKVEREIKETKSSTTEFVEGDPVKINPARLAKKEDLVKGNAVSGFVHPAWGKLEGIVNYVYKNEKREYVQVKWNSGGMLMTTAEMFVKIPNEV